MTHVSEPELKTGMVNTTRGVKLQSTFFLSVFKATFIC